MSYRCVGIISHPVGNAASLLAGALATGPLAATGDVWHVQTGDERGAAERMQRTDLLVCIGGDGTVLWAARNAVPYPIPIVSINMGRLGFLSELDPDGAIEGVAAVLGGRGTLEQRSMLECTAPQLGLETPLVALNDIVIGRAAMGRPVYLSVAVDGVHLARVRADALIVSSATGSTAYNLSAGGPVLMPLSTSFVLTPVAPHLSRMRPIVLPPDAEVEVQVETDHAAIMSVDGRLDAPLESGQIVTVRRSQHSAHFVRTGPPGAFFERLAHHLNLSTRHGSGTQ